jgi:hypothetical protein
MAFITDLEAVHKLAHQRRDEFDVLRYRLQLDDDLSDEYIDDVMKKIADPVFAGIDCRECGNCCRVLEVEVGSDDLERLATGLQTTVAHVQQYVDIQDRGDPDIIGIFRPHPCPFLRGKLCSVYAHRPTTCQDYPAMFPDFRWMLDYLIEGSALCPIIYNVLDRLAEQIDTLQHQP